MMISFLLMKTGGRMILWQFEYEMIGIKDPRICILLPFWLRVISKLNLAPYFVIV